jgi:hypothetical protein
MDYAIKNMLMWWAMILHMQLKRNLWQLSIAAGSIWQATAETLTASTSFAAKAKKPRTIPLPNNR